MTADDAQRVAVATLLRVIEPGLPAVVRHIRSFGVEQTLADIAAGASIPGFDLAPLRARLRDADGERELERASAVGARLVVPGDAEWPLRLADLQRRDLDCFGLWVRGPLPLDEAVERSVAVVGMRACTDYGIHVTHELTAELVSSGWTIVSGLAFGIDAVAHRAALGAGGTTVAVLACGIDAPYPKAHTSLYERICATGLVISEHPLGAAPIRSRFLVRNRVIAALSLGTVVTEMAVRSGAMSTAGHAVGLNRHAMCVPGPVTSAASAGCHRFLREHPGAALVTRAAEVVELCGHMGELAEPVSGETRPRDALGPVISRVLDAVPVRRGAGAASVARTALLDVTVTDAALAALRALGLARCDEEGRRRMTELARDQRRAGRRAEGDPLPFESW